MGGLPIWSQNCSSTFDLRDCRCRLATPRVGCPAGSIVEVAKHIWKHHESELKASGDLYYTWQYDTRWACTKLRERKIVQAAETSDRGEWRLQPQLA
jgi:hypothetical protein